jgi:hypothetical protein
MRATVFFEFITAPRLISRVCSQLSEAMGSALIKTDLLPIYVKLLRDPEAEVRVHR